MQELWLLGEQPLDHLEPPLLASEVDRLKAIEGASVQRGALAVEPLHHLEVAADSGDVDRLQWLMLVIRFFVWRVDAGSCVAVLLHIHQASVVSGCVQQLVDLSRAPPVHRSADFIFTACIYEHKLTGTGYWPVLRGLGCTGG